MSSARSSSSQAAISSPSSASRSRRFHPLARGLDILLGGQSDVLAPHVAPGMFDFSVGELSKRRHCTTVMRSTTSAYAQWISASLDYDFGIGVIVLTNLARLRPTSENICSAFEATSDSTRGPPF